MNVYVKQKQIHRQTSRRQTYVTKGEMEAGRDTLGVRE